jgi:muramoyltetrapeptide carboxypeptidase
MSSSHWPPKKPKALVPGSRISVFAPASPAEHVDMVAGLAEMTSQGFQLATREEAPPEGYFAGTAAERRDGFLHAANADYVDGLIALRGGYGSNYLLDSALERDLATPKCVIGFSDITALHIYLWQRCGWITFYGPMVTAGLNAGAGARKGYDQASFLQAVSKTDGGWHVPLQGDALAAGEAEGRLLGGCMTLLEATLGTPWELDTRDAILLLEDRAMKPYQVDRVLMHLKQAGKLAGVKGMVLGEFPECEPSVAGSPTVRDVCARILGPLGMPMVFGAPVGHTLRPMLTLPLGVKARLRAQGEGVLEILEAAVVP